MGYMFFVSNSVVLKSTQERFRVYTPALFPVPSSESRNPVGNSKEAARKRCLASSERLLIRFVWALWGNLEEEEKAESSVSVNYAQRGWNRPPIVSDA